MFKIGITGNIGSGKTTVCKVFEVLGVPVFYADDEAKKVMVQDESLIEDIKSAFGHEAYLPGGLLNRKHIASIVFNNPTELARLNALVHPAVFRAFDNWVLKFANIAVPYVIKEAALLFESDSYKLCDRSLLVSAPLDLRIQRVIHRDNISVDEVKSREARQFTEEKKRGLTNDLVINDDTQLVIPQVLALHQRYLSLAPNK